jgi:peptidoglycan/LPS O-acetylase OafA/YrhL
MQSGFMPVETTLDLARTSQPVPFAKSQASVLLDLIRGLAATFVLLSHARNLLFIDYPQISVHRAWFFLPYLISSAGHQSVVIFFVLSGFLIGGSIFRSLDRGTWSMPSYLAHRCTRLWIVLLPGLLSCLLFDRLGQHFGWAPALYAGRVPNHITVNSFQSSTASVFLGNLFFLQTIRVPTFGSNTALWSLANEFWYYLLFPLVWLALLPRSTALSSRIVNLVLAALIVWLITPSIRLEFLTWILGAFLALLPAPSCSGWLRACAAALYLPLFFLSTRLQVVPASLRFADCYQDLLLAVLTCAFLWVTLSATGPARPTLWTAFARGLSRFSFTLYVVHIPLLMLLTALVLGEHRWYPTLAHSLAGIGLICLTMLYAYALASVTEFRTDRVRTWIEGRLRRNAPALARPAVLLPLE